MSNFVARDFSSLYGPIKEKAGGAYFFTQDGWVKNPRCPEATELRRADAPGGRTLSRLGLAKGKEMYPLLKEHGRLDYLTRPGDHLDLFSRVI